MVKKRDIESIESSENIFRDLGFPDAKVALAKAILAALICRIVENRKLTQAQAVAMMGIDQRKVSEIIRGKLSKCPLDQLLRYALLLGQAAEI
jgi:predicted XRE-type DNA-binding protein